MSKLFIISGHYGSGKTEFAINHALKLARENGQALLLDLDVVNPAFRARGFEKQLASLGVSVISTREDMQGIDLPAISPQVAGALRQQNTPVVVDLGGNAAGATAFAQFAPALKNRQVAHWQVINANRPQTAKAGDALLHLRQIEQVLGIPVDGLISNTHLMDHTSLTDIQNGALLTEEVQQQSGIPLVHICVPHQLLPQATQILNPDLLYPLDTFMPRPWQKQ